MNLVRKTIEQAAVATGVATALLASTFFPSRTTEAGSPRPQQKKEVVEDVVKQEPKKQVDPAQTKVMGKAAVTIQVMPLMPAMLARPAIRLEKAVRVDVMIAAPVAIAGPGVVMVAPAAGAANLEVMSRHFVEQLRPSFRAELRFLTSIASPSPAQRREIALEGGRKVKETALKMAETQQGMNNGGRRVMTASPEPRKVIRDAMAEAAKARLSPEQFARLQKEIGLREQDQQEAMTLNIVTNLDQLLILGNGQREKLGEAILAHWDERIYPTFELFTIYESYFPMIPDQYVNPILNAEQRKIWQGARKLNFAQVRNNNFFFNNGMGNNGVNVNVKVEDEDEKAALAEEVKK